MEQTPDASPAPGRAHWTPARQRIFLAALLDSGSVTDAAKAAGMSRWSATRLRRRLAGAPFDRIWAQAIAEHERRLADPFADLLTPGREGADSVCDGADAVRA